MKTAIKQETLNKILQQGGELSEEVATLRAKNTTLLAACNEALEWLEEAAQPIYDPENKDEGMNSIIKTLQDATTEEDPFEKFEKWCGANGFQDVIDCEPEMVDLERLHQAIEVYGKVKP